MSHEACCDDGWKVLLYMGWGGSPGFEHNQNAVLDAIAATDFEHVEVVYQFAHRDRVERGRIRNRQRTILSTSPAIKITDPSHLTSFLDWAEDEFPSRYTALFAKDHGQGAIAERAAGALAPAPVPVPVLLAPGIFLDDGRYMPIASFAHAIEQSRAGHVDLLGLDACRLGYVEVAYELRKAATVLVISEMTELTTGWAYPDVLKYLALERDAASPRDLAIEVVRTATAFRLIALELAWIESVAHQLSALADELGADQTQARLLDWVRRTFPRSLNDGISVALLVEKLATQDLGQRITLHAITNALASARALPDPPPAQLPDIGLYFPTTRGSASIASYGAAAFAVDTHWAEFIGTLNHWLLTS